MITKIFKQHQPFGWRSAAIALCLVSAAACGDLPGDQSSEIEQTQNPLLIELAAELWPHGDVDICFDTRMPIPDRAFFEEAKQQTKLAVRATWEKAARVRFRFDENCAGVAAGDGTGTDSPQLPFGPTLLRLSAVNNLNGVGGASSVGKGGGGFAFYSYCVPTLPGANCTRDLDGNPNGDRLEYLRKTAIHELGHQLGFRHEHQRRDTPDSVATWCVSASAAERIDSNSAFISDGSMANGLRAYQGPYDKNSVMNYCRDQNNDSRPDLSWNNVVDQISDGDKAGVAALYGPPRIGDVVGKELDYIKCSEENETCAVGSSLKVVAFGAPGKFVFKDLAGFVSCTVAQFGADPAPGVHKSCHVSNFSPVAPEGASGAPLAFVQDVAFGANGIFNFKRIAANGVFICDVGTFGDPTPGVVKRCYRPLPGYTFAANEGASIPVSAGRPMAYGANGKYMFKILSGTKTCSSATFGADPTPGVPKMCFQVPGTIVAEEGASFTAPRGTRVLYGSGLNGAFVMSTALTGSCTNAAFGDPDSRVPKRCYAVPVTP